MEKNGSSHRYQEILEQVFTHFRGEVFYYALMLLKDQKHAQRTMRSIFANYFCTFSKQHSLSDARLELLRSVWKSVSLKGIWLWKTNEILLDRSILALKRCGLTVREIEIVMDVRSKQVEALYSSERPHIKTIQTVDWESCEQLRPQLTIDEIWGFIASEKSKRRKRLFVFGGCICILVALTSGYFYKMEHLPAEKSHISLAHPLHLTPKGPIIHSCMWSGEIILEQWQNAETGQTKSVYHDKNLEEVTYWVNNNKYILEYINGILRSTKQIKISNNLSPLFQRMNKNENLMRKDGSYNGKQIDVYFDQNTIFYVDKPSQLILFQSIKGKNNKVTTSFYGYEYLQSVGYGFFDVPTNIQFMN